MSEDKNKSLRDILFRTVLSAVSKGAEEDDDDFEGESSSRRKQRLDISTAKELITSVAGWAGKGKDELVQMLFREIGQAVAAMLKEPLTQVIENRKLEISIEFAPREGKGKPKKRARTKTKIRSR